MNRRISTAHKQPVVQAAHPVLAPINEATGEPAKLMKVPACWTPFNRRANAAFIYIFFRNVSLFAYRLRNVSYQPKMCPSFQCTEHFLPPDPEMIPQHLLFVFDAYKRQNIFDACKHDNLDVLAFGYFSSEDINSCTLLGKKTDQYELLKPTV